MHTFKRNDIVETPDGNGRVITLPIGKYSQDYLVLFGNGRAATYPEKDLALATENHGPAAPAVATDEVS